MWVLFVVMEAHLLNYLFTHVPFQYCSNEGKNKQKYKNITNGEREHLCTNKNLINVTFLIRN